MHHVCLRHPRRTPLTATRLTAAVVAAGATLTLTACGSAATGATDPAPAAAGTAALTVTDPWVKAARSGMTAAFGTLVNTGDRDVVVTGVSTEVSPDTELHETVAADGALQMQEVDDGFTVPAGGERELSPGGDHLMLMDLQRPLRPGERVVLTLELAGGGTTELTAVVKDFSGADEEYDAGHGS